MSATNYLPPAPFGHFTPSEHRDACGVGFVANIKGEKSRSIVEQGLEILSRLAHRAASGADPETGDGAGILLQLPHRFFKAEGLALGFEMPRRRRYGVGQVFLPRDPHQRAACERILEETVIAEGQRVMGWRDVPVDAGCTGVQARSVLPVMRQIYVQIRRVPPSAAERKLYVIRKLAELRVRAEGIDPDCFFHLASLSTETIVYKGLLLPRQLPAFYADLRAPEMVSAIAVVHSRFSTNTFPTWDLAQPFRYIAHNGEINTIRGNGNWMRARRSVLQSAKFEGGIDRLFPTIVPGKSDSAQFDNMLELLHLGGRSLPHAMMMMIPEAWESHESMPTARRDFYRYSASLLEPWDGPAAIVFSDGHLVGATLDRNGLRPARYLVTTDGRIVLSSETGVLDFPPETIVRKGRLRPGRMLIVDTDEGRIVDDDEVKHDIASRFPYGRWLAKNVFDVEQFPEASRPPRLMGEELLRSQRAFGFTDEDLEQLIGPMAETGKEPTGAMGSDTPIAALSDQSPPLANYFHQLFAQVTNPPIDPIREALVMTLTTNIGPDGNTFEETPEQCHQLGLGGPIITNAELARLLSLKEGVFEPVRLSMLFAVDEGPAGLADAITRLCAAAVDAIDDGLNVLVLSDRGVDATHAAIPAPLAVAAVHQHLVREGTRLQAGLIIETGDAREVHDFAVLLALGTAAINPYATFDTIAALVEHGAVSVDPATAQQNYIKAVEDGIRKVMSKMGISSLQSYRGAQIFEAVGLSPEVIEAYFCGMSSRLGGLTIEDLGAEVLERHARGFGPQMNGHLLPVGGQYQWRRRGEQHKWTPQTVALLQAAARDNDPATFAAYCEAMDAEVDGPITLRGMLVTKPLPSGAISVEEVEPATELVKRFVTGAMSFGSISAEAHEALAIAMNRLGGRSNSGEGGEEPHRYVADENGDLRRSAIKQVASGRFGVTAEYLVQADDLQIKIAQGAKPGEGGQLPGHKVDERIAKVRCSTPGVTLISPPPHHDIYSIEDLAQLIYDLSMINPKARVSVKLVSEAGVGTIAAGVAKAKAGAIVIAGMSGGTGASPLSSLRHAGMPWELGLAETQQVLVGNRLRDRVRLQVDGGFRTPRDVVIGALLGAEEFGVATAALITQGCILLRKCHENTCSVGIATQDPRLRARYAGQVEHIVNFFMLLAEGLRHELAKLGARTLEEIVGRGECLSVRDDITHWKARRLDLSKLLAVPADDALPRRFARAMPPQVADHIDQEILARAGAALDGKPHRISMPIGNLNRAAGSYLSGEIARRHGSRGLPEDTLTVAFSGSAGQSFGAFLINGVSFQLEGDANDFVGKGLSGGRLAVYPPIVSPFSAEQNVIIGNTALYGATAGSLFAAGLAGERFAVRNSGASAVIEGVGDHGCEYMTGGAVVVLGPTGRNFAAGMSGGVAFVLDRERAFRSRCNLGMVELESLVDESDIWLVYGLIERHVQHTGSALGKRVLDNWEHLVSEFVKVMPTDYKRVLQARRASLRPPNAAMTAQGVAAASALAMRDAISTAKGGAQ